MTPVRTARDRYLTYALLVVLGAAIAVWAGLPATLLLPLGPSATESPTGALG